MNNWILSIQNLFANHWSWTWNTPYTDGSLYHEIFRQFSRYIVIFLQLANSTKSPFANFATASYKRLDLPKDIYQFTTVKIEGFHY